MGFSTIARTRRANSSGRPSRRGCGTWAARDSWASAGNDAIMGVLKMPGAIVMTRMRRSARSRASGSVMAATPPFEAAYAAWPT
ncbi:hypothetical protein D3C74_412120 [compost metagenome]